MSKLRSAKEIVSDLLDKYDHSLLSLKQNKVRQTIVLKVDALSFPSYLQFSKNSERDAAVAVFKTLESLVFLIVEKNPYGYYGRITLKTDEASLSEARLYAEKEDPEKIANFYHSRFLALASSDDKTLASFASKMSEFTINHKNLSKALAYFGDEETLGDIVKAIPKIDSLEKEVRERNFSISLFGDSKRFAQIEPRIDKILREFSSQEFSYSDKPSRVMGVVANPSFALIKNGLGFVYHGEKIDLSKFDSPFPLFDDVIVGMEITSTKAKRVITIENETTFFDFDDPEAIIVYLAGFHNKIRKTLLQKIFAFNPSLTYLHWGDIDAGGFYIFNHLREDTGIPFTPWRMGLEELQSYVQLAKPLTKNDIQRLSEQRKKPSFSMFYDVIDYMLKNNKKLEQEVFSLSVEPKAN